MDDTLIWILVVVGVAAIVAAVTWVVSNRWQSAGLKRRFGPEYDRTIERTGGDRKRAEADLGTRVSRREQLDLKPLEPRERDEYFRRWQQTQAEFVDQPGVAVQDAQTLLDEVMAERGYPVGKRFEEQADLISVDHPEVVEHYRVAHHLQLESRGTEDIAVATEERRQALVHYRALFAELLDGAEVEHRKRRKRPTPDTGADAGADVADEHALDRGWIAGGG